MKISRVLETNAFLFRNRISRKYGPEFPLSKIPAGEWSALAEEGYDAVWLMGVWARSPAGRRQCLEDPLLRSGFDSEIPGWQPENVLGSPYAVRDYQVDPRLDRPEDFPHLRETMNAAGLKLILDFVPNHLAMDHPWMDAHPEYFMAGTAEDLEHDPDLYFRPEGRPGIFAHGKDPFFPSWKDSVQVNYFSREARQAMIQEALRVAEVADGCRCDMAMLVTNRIFAKTWSRSAPNRPEPGGEFRPELIAEVKARWPEFRFIAEVYWGLEWELQQQGFDATYDKALYDRLLHDPAESVRKHFEADSRYQARSLRFTENHDEARAVRAFGRLKSLAAAVIALTAPGWHLVHDGQQAGKRTHQPIQIIQEPADHDDPGVAEYYRRLSAFTRAPVMRQGLWQLLETAPAWEGNASHLNVVAFLWRLWDDVRIVAVNYSGSPAQARLPVPAGALQAPRLRLRDRLTLAEYVWDSRTLAAPGLYVELDPWQSHLFAVKPA